MHFWNGSIIVCWGHNFSVRFVILWLQWNARYYCHSIARQIEMSARNDLCFCLILWMSRALISNRSHKSDQKVFSINVLRAICKMYIDQFHFDEVRQSPSASKMDKVLVIKCNALFLYCCEFVCIQIDTTNLLACCTQMVCSLFFFRNHFHVSCSIYRTCTLTHRYINFAYKNNRFDIFFIIMKSRIKNSVQWLVKTEKRKRCVLMMMMMMGDEVKACNRIQK